VRLVGLNYAGGPGLELHVPAEQARQVEQALRTAAQAAGTVLTDLGTYALDGLRIEAGIRAWGAEFGPDDPDDATQLARLVLEAEAQAPGRPDEPAWAWGGEPVLLDGRVIGHVTSAGWSSLAHGCVAHVRLEPDTTDPARAAPLDRRGQAVQLELCSEHGVASVAARLWSRWQPPGWPGGVPDGS
jgi:4-methylaminobutanoate oxidase (formaldehyde-forming)